MAVVQRFPPPPASSQLRRRRDPCSGDTPPPVCRYWKSGHCNRKPCRFLHADVLAPAPIVKKSNTWVNPKPGPDADGDATVPPVPPTTKRQADARPQPPRLTKGSCHSQEEPAGAWCVGDGFRGVAQLKGHAKAVTGVALPEDSDKLFSGSLDGTVRIWDCGTGQCVHVAPLHEGEVRSLIAMGPWVLVGVRGAVKALHTGSGKETILRAPTAHDVTALLAEDGEHLFAGTEDGAIYMWRLSQEHQRFDEVAALTGHEQAVASLAQVNGALYSGSADGDIKVWDIKTHRCIYSFVGHASKVTALLCWERFLLSSSDDGTVKAWWSSKLDHGDGTDLKLEVHYIHREEGGLVVTMDGTYDADKKPVLLVSRSDGAVRVYDLPSFKTRGQIRCNGEVRTISLKPPGIVFTGDESGEIRVVKWTPSAAAKAEAESLTVPSLESSTGH